MTLSQKNFQKGSIITRCFFYKNVHEIPLTIEKITLFYTLKKDISLKSLVKASTLLS